MTTWINHVAVAGPRNATTSHTVNPASGTVVAGTAFTPTAGRFLICMVEGAVTSTTPSGWTLPTAGSSINNTGLYVFTKTAAGSDTITTTHNGSNYPVIFDFYEFAAGSTFVGSASSSGVVTSGGAGPTLSGLTGTNLIFGVAGLAQTGSTAITWTWSGGAVEAVDTSTPISGTDGYGYSAAYLEDSVLTSASLAATASNNGGAGGTCERLMFAVHVATGGATNFNGSASLASTSTASSAGVVGKLIGATLAATVAITGAGVVGTSSGGSVAEAATVTATGVTGAATGAALTGSASLTAAGTVTSGTSAGATLAGSATLTGAGAVGTATGATLPATATRTATGVVGSSSAASLAGTATVTGAGSVTAAGTGNATLGETATLTTAGRVGASTGSSIADTATITTVGVVGRAAGTSIPVTVVTTAAGTVTAGGTSGAAINAASVVTATGIRGASAASTITGTDALTAAGVTGSSASATRAATATLTASGVVGQSAGATLNATAAITADGKAVDPHAFRDITVTARLTPSTWTATYLDDSPWGAALTDSPWTATLGDTMILGSLEYAHVTIDADHDITGDTVEASFDERLTWHTMTHTTGNTWRILVGPGQAVNPTGNDTVYVRVTDSPEIPVINAGRLYLTR